jgi:hypothetical protein
MACRQRRVSSTERPKPRLLMVECCTTPSLSMMNRPRRAMPSCGGREGGGPRRGRGGGVRRGVKRKNQPRPSPQLAAAAVSRCSCASPPLSRVHARRRTTAPTPRRAEARAYRGSLAVQPLPPPPNPPQRQAQGSPPPYLGEHAVGLGDGLLEVRHEGVGQVAQAAALAVGLDPREVGELGVHAHAQHLGAELLELSEAVAEGGDLGGADKGEVQGIEEQHHVLGGDVWGRGMAGGGGVGDRGGAMRSASRPPAALGGALPRRPRPCLSADVATRPAWHGA